MSNFRSFSVLFIIIGLLVFSAAIQAANVAPKLHLDPFEKPDSLLLQHRQLETAVLPQPVSWQPELRATMRFAQGGMVNIGGDIIAIGEEINGFRLLEVQERSAIFSKDGKKFPVSLDDVADQ